MDDYALKEIKQDIKVVPKEEISANVLSGKQMWNGKEIRKKIEVKSEIKLFESPLKSQCWPKSEDSWSIQTKSSEILKYEEIKQENGIKDDLEIPEPPTETKVLMGNKENTLFQAPSTAYATNVEETILGLPQEPIMNKFAKNEFTTAMIKSENTVKTLVVKLERIDKKFSFDGFKIFENEKNSVNTLSMKLLSKLLLSETGNTDSNEDMDTNNTYLEPNSNMCEEDLPSFTDSTPTNIEKKQIEKESCKRQCRYSKLMCTYADCNKSFRKKENLVDHIKRVHLNELLTCRICGMLISSKQNLKKHENLHKKVYNFVCPECKLSFKEKGGLKMHFMCIHQGVKPFICTICKSSFKTKSNLLAHNEVHHKEKTNVYVCDLCSKRFDRRTYLERHIKTHNDSDKTFFCNECDIKCRSKTDIERHVVTHVGGGYKPFKCDECSMAFSRNSKFKRHQLVHSNERPYKCDLCTKKYKDSASMKVHQDSVHLKKKMTCDLCGFSSVNKVSFKRHMRKEMRAKLELQRATKAVIAK